MISVLDIQSVHEKIRHVENECHQLLTDNSKLTMPAALTSTPARDASVVSRNELPPRVGLQSSVGQARLLHGLANIELQAMELGLRTLYNFKEAPQEFRKQLADIVIDESRHLKLCIDGMRALGFEWGFVPVQTHLWDATSNEDSLIDRILIVHCYLEGSGLDSTDQILKKLASVENRTAREIVKVIADEEVGHVQFGTKWFRNACVEKKLDASTEFGTRLQKLKERIPRRGAKINPAARLAAGFNAEQITFLQSFSGQ